MAPDRLVTLRLPDALYRAALARARAEEVPATEVIRAALAREVGGDGDRIGAVAAVRGALAGEIAAAADWLDLQSRLRGRGFVLRRRDGALWLHTWPVERALIPLARLGPDEAALTLHFRAPFPAHAPVPRPAPAPAAAPPWRRRRARR
jgi:hypothetical protein